MIHVLFFAGLYDKESDNASYGTVLFDSSGKEVTMTHGNLGVTTPVVASYFGLLFGLQMCLDLGYDNIVVRGDDKVVIQQSMGITHSHDSKFRMLYNKLKILENQFNSVIYEHINKSLNIRSRHLANLSLIFPDT